MPCANLSLACIKMQLQHYRTKCIKRVDGFPEKIMILVTTLGRTLPLTTYTYIFLFKCRNIKIRLMSHILKDALTETKRIINL